MRTPSQIRRHLLDHVAPLVSDLGKFQAFYLMLLPQFQAVLPMLVTKFDELFGGRVTGRCYTTEQTLHAKTVVPWDEELFISFGYQNENFGSARIQRRLFEKAARQRARTGA